MASFSVVFTRAVPFVRLRGKVTSWTCNEEDLDHFRLDSEATVPQLLSKHDEISQNGAQLFWAMFLNRRSSGFSLERRRFFFARRLRPLMNSTFLTADEMPSTLCDALAQAARDAASVEAIVEAASRLDYRALDDQSNVVASALAAAGIGKNDHVGICAGNSVEWLVLFYGILKAGAVVVPINTRLKPQEIGYQLRKADVRLLFTVDTLLRIDFLALLREICPELDHSLPGSSLPRLECIVVLGGTPPKACISFDEFVSRQAPCSTPPKPHDPALIQFTSGTTSLPKAALLSHDSMVRDAYWVGKRMGARSGDRLLSARPFFHVAGSTLSIVLSCVHQITLVTMQRFLVDEVLHLLEDEKCTLTSGNDTMFLMMLGSDQFDPAKYHLRGSWAAVTGPLLKRIVTEFNAPETVTGYGLSEASPNISTSDYRDTLDDRAAGWMHVHDGLEVRIVDPETGALRAASELGEIQVRGWCVMLGYYADPEATAATMTSDGFLKTGDIGKMDNRGRLAFVGRLKEIIRVGGENVAPTELENLLHQHPDILQAQVFALPEPRLIEVPAAYVLTRQDSALTAEEISDWLRPKVAGFKMPRFVKVVDSFETIGITASGKVQKSQLRTHAMTAFGLNTQGEHS